MREELLFANEERSAGSTGDVSALDIEAIIGWWPEAEPNVEIAMPARLLLQDATGVPAVVELAPMRDASSWRAE